MFLQIEYYVNNIFIHKICGSAGNGTNDDLVFYIIVLYFKLKYRKVTLYLPHKKLTLFVNIKKRKTIEKKSSL